MVQNNRWKGYAHATSTSTVSSDGLLPPKPLNHATQPVAMNDYSRRLQRARVLVRDLRDSYPNHCEVLSFCSDFEIKYAEDEGKWKGGYERGIEDARDCCRVAIDWLHSGYGLRKLGWGGTLRMVMGAIKLCMRLTTRPRQTDSFAMPLDSRMCLKVSEDSECEFQQLYWAIQSAIIECLAPRVMAEKNLVPPIVDDVSVLRHAASFYFRTDDMKQMKRHVRAVIDMTMKLLVRFSQDGSEGEYMMTQHFQVRKLFELRKNVEIMIDRLLKLTLGSQKEGDVDVGWRLELNKKRDLFSNAKGPVEPGKSRTAGGQ